MYSLWKPVQTARGWNNVWGFWWRPKHLVWSVSESHPGAFVRWCLGHPLCLNGSAGWKWIWSGEGATANRKWSAELWPLAPLLLGLMSSYLPLAPVALRGLTRKRRHKQLRRAFAAFGSPRKPAATRGSSCSSRALANCLIGAAVSVHNAKAPQALNSNEESGISSPSSKKEKLAIIFFFF